MAMKLFIVLFICISSVASISNQEIAERLVEIDSVAGLKAFLEDLDKEKIYIDWDDSLASRSAQSSCNTPIALPLRKFRIGAAKITVLDQPGEDSLSVVMNGGMKRVGCAPRHDCADSRFVCIFSTESGSSGSYSRPKPKSESAGRSYPKHSDEPGYQRDSSGSPRSYNSYDPPVRSDSFGSSGSSGSSTPRDSPASTLPIPFITILVALAFLFL